METASRVCSHALQVLLSGPVGKDSERLRPAERGVGEVDQVEVGSTVSDGSGEQGEVVVLHQHHGVSGSGLDDECRHLGVQGAVRMPRLTPMGVEAGPPGQIP